MNKKGKLVLHVLNGIKNRACGLINASVTEIERIS